MGLPNDLPSTRGPCLRPSAIASALLGTRWAGTLPPPLDALTRALQCSSCTASLLLCGGTRLRPGGPGSTGRAPCWQPWGPAARACTEARTRVQARPAPQLRPARALHALATTLHAQALLLRPLHLRAGGWARLAETAAACVPSPPPRTTPPPPCARAGPLTFPWHAAGECAPMLSACLRVVQHWGMGGGGGVVGAAAGLCGGRGRRDEEPPRPPSTRPCARLPRRPSPPAPACAGGSCRG